MKRRILSSILILVIFAFTGLAQTQQGLVKIKGRYSPSGQVIPGPPLAGVSVKVKGRNAVLSNKNGTFQFPVPSAKFYVERVALAGYQLTDPDLLSRQFSYSKNNTLAVVMERPEDHARDVEDAKNSIRRQMRKEIRKREDEIDRLREENKITEQKYRDLMQKCREDEEKSENLVQAMANRFASIDFDQIDEENKQLNILILDGELVKADSILRSKGNFAERVANHERVKNANSETRKALEASERYVAHNTQALAEEAYYRSQIHSLRFQTDSAIYYLEQRANLDTLNVYWQLEVAHLCNDTISTLKKAIEWYHKALATTSLKYGEDPLKCSILNSIAITYNILNKHETAVEYSQQALDIAIKRNFIDEIQYSYERLCHSYYKMGELSLALDYGRKAFNIASIEYGDNSKEIISISHLIGYIYITKGNYNDAIEYFKKILNIIENNNDDEWTLITSYNCIGLCYVNQGYLNEAYDYYTKAYELTKKMYDQNHPRIAESLNYLGGVLYRQDKYEQALKYYQDALLINLKFLGPEHPSIATNMNNIGNCYFGLQDVNAALKNYQNAIKIWSSTLGENHPELIECYDNISTAYLVLENYEKAFYYCKKSIEIYQTKIGEDHPDLIESYYILARLYYKTDDYINAIDVYHKIARMSECQLPYKRNDLQTALYWIYFLYGKLLEKDKSIWQQYKDFVSENTIILVPSSDISKRNENNEYILLEYGMWNFSNNCNLCDIIVNADYTPNSVLVLKGEDIIQLDYSEMKDLQFTMKPCSLEEKKIIYTHYTDWKSKQQ